MCITRRKSGFTLIELLVVIAIIAILAAILFPVFASAKKTAIVTKCMSNMKNWANAGLLYMTDNNNAFPSAIPCKGYNHQHPGMKAPQDKAFYDVVGKYAGTKAEAMRWCPMWKTLTRQEQAWVKYGGWTYWYNCDHLTTVSTWGGYPEAELCGHQGSEVTKASKVPFISEQWLYHPQMGTGRAATFAFVDGHASIRVMTTAQWQRIRFTSRNGVEPERIPYP